MRAPRALEANKAIASAAGDVPLSVDAELAGRLGCPPRRTLACVAVRLVLAEDSYLAREGLRRLLETHDPG
jgi:hypothetical protein